jgi:hypothetical protein
MLGNSKNAPNWAKIPHFERNKPLVGLVCPAERINLA